MVQRQDHGLGRWHGGPAVQTYMGWVRAVQARSDGLVLPAQGNGAEPHDTGMQDD